MTARPAAAFQHRRGAVVALQVPVPILVPADGVNAVVDGIGLVSTLLAVDRLKIHRSCKGFIDEIPGYSWSEPHAERGEDQGRRPRRRLAALRDSDDTSALAAAHTDRGLASPVRTRAARGLRLPGQVRQARHQQPAAGGALVIWPGS